MGFFLFFYCCFILCFNFLIEGHAAISREQFYQIAPKRNEKPPQLPPRDNSIYSHSLPTVS